MKTLFLTHAIWEKLLLPGDTAIDATCGNGHDTLVLAKIIDGNGAVLGFDIQETAIAQTAALLDQHLTPKQRASVSLYHASHEAFQTSSAKLIVYNLGYLPGGDKTLTTTVERTLKSLNAATALIQPFGAISVTCYCGHDEGAKEEQEILKFAQSLSKHAWNVFYQRSLNREKAPSHLLFLKNGN